MSPLGFGSVDSECPVTPLGLHSRINLGWGKAALLKSDLFEAFDLKVTILDEEGILAVRNFPTKSWETLEDVSQRVITFLDSTLLDLSFARNGVELKDKTRTISDLEITPAAKILCLVRTRPERLFLSLLKEFNDILSLDAFSASKKDLRNRLSQIDLETEEFSLAELQSFASEFEICIPFSSVHFAWKNILHHWRHFAGQAESPSELMGLFFLLTECTRPNLFAGDRTAFRTKWIKHFVQVCRRSYQVTRMFSFLVFFLVGNGILRRYFTECPDATAFLKNLGLAPIHSSEMMTGCVSDLFQSICPHLNVMTANTSKPDVEDSKLFSFIGFDSIEQECELRGSRESEALAPQVSREGQPKKFKSEHSSLKKKVAQAKKENSEALRFIADPSSGLWFTEAVSAELSSKIASVSTDADLPALMLWMIEAIPCHFMAESWLSERREEVVQLLRLVISLHE